MRQKVTQSDLAAMAGIARENVSRILNDWMRRQLVSRLAGYYCLENKAALEREAASSMAERLHACLDATSQRACPLRHYAEVVTATSATARPLRGRGASPPS